MKTCSHCQVSKNEEDFRPGRNQCKVCDIEKQKQRNNKNKDTDIEARKQKRQAEKEKDRKEREQIVQDMIASYKTPEWDKSKTKMWGKGYMLIMTPSQSYQYKQFCCYLQDHLTFDEILKRIDPPVEKILKTSPLYEKSP